MRIGIFLFLSRRQVDFRKSEIASALPEPRAHCKGLKSTASVAIAFLVIVSACSFRKTGFHFSGSCCNAPLPVAGCGSSRRGP